MEWFWIVVGLGVVAFFFATCVCCVACIEFNGPGTIAGDWEEVAGDWAVVSGRIVSSDASAILIGNTDVGNLGGSITARVYQFIGNKSRIIGAYVDADNYIFAEVLAASSHPPYDNSYIRLYARESGVNTLLEEHVGPIGVDSFGGLTINLCWTGEYATVYTNNPGSNGCTYLVGYTTINGGRAGVANAADGVGVSFELINIHLQKNLNLSCAECRGCIESCTDQLPESIEITLPAAWEDGDGNFGWSGGGCATCDETFNGATFVLDRVTNTNVQMFDDVENGVNPWAVSKIARPNCFQSSTTGYSLSCLYHYDHGTYCTKTVYGETKYGKLEIFAWFETLVSGAKTRRLHVRIRDDGNLHPGSTAEWGSGVESPGPCVGAEWELDYYQKCGGWSSGTSCKLVAAPGTMIAVASP